MNINIGMLQTISRLSQVQNKRNKQGISGGSFKECLHKEIAKTKGKNM